MQNEELRRRVAHHLAHARMYAEAMAEHLRLAREALEQEEVLAHDHPRDRNGRACTRDHGRAGRPHR
jgi:hypothetical protein